MTETTPRPTPLAFHEALELAAQAAEETERWADKAKAALIQSAERIRQLERDRAELMEAMGWLLVLLEAHRVDDLIADQAKALLARLTEQGK